MKRTAALIAVTGIALGGFTVTAGPASARPVDPREDIVRPGDLGPDRADWWCTYQQSIGEVSCAYAPGHQRPLRPVMREEADQWWNVWSWFN